MPPFLTMDDLDTHGRVVLVRVDLNSPIGPNGEILDDIRFRGHIPTIEALKDAKTVLLAHQSRPGKRDFTTMKRREISLPGPGLVGEEHRLSIFQGFNGRNMAAKTNVIENFSIGPNR